MNPACPRNPVLSKTLLVLPLLTLACTVLALLGWFLLGPSPLERHLTVCPVLSATGLRCPFCGGLTSVWLLSRGQIKSSLEANAFLWIAAPLSLAAALAHARLRTWPTTTPHGRALGIVAGLASLVLWTLVRNITGA